MNLPENLLYTATHEWVQKTSDGVLIGLTDHAQHELGDIVFVGFPTVGNRFGAGETLCDVESVKAVSEVYAPVSGTVVAVNEDVVNNPENINNAPYETWLVNLTDVSGLEDLLTAAQYADVVAQEA